VRKPALCRDRAKRHAPSVQAEANEFPVHLSAIRQRHIGEPSVVKIGSVVADGDDLACDQVTQRAGGLVTLTRRLRMRGRTRSWGSSSKNTLILPSLDDFYLPSPTPAVRIDKSEHLANSARTELSSSHSRYIVEI
jgi:hypothetical protein